MLPVHSSKKTLSEQALRAVCAAPRGARLWPIKPIHKYALSTYYRPRTVRSPGATAVGKSSVRNECLLSPYCAPGTAPCCPGGHSRDPNPAWVSQEPPEANPPILFILQIEAQRGSSSFTRSHSQGPGCATVGVSPEVRLAEDFGLLPPPRRPPSAAPHPHPTLSDPRHSGRGWRCP